MSEAAATKTNSTAAESTAVKSTAVEIDSKADEIIKNHVYGSGAMGLVPIPLVDLAGFTLIQMNMLRRLSEVYEVEFKDDVVKTLIGALVGGIAPLSLAAPVASMLKVVPFVGMTTSALTLSITGGATTYALGKVFAQHFASGGTFLDFNPESVRNYFREKFEEGKKVASKS